MDALSVSSLNPVMLRCTHFNGYQFRPMVEMAERTVYDYEIEYYIRSGGAILIDGKRIPFSAVGFHNNYRLYSKANSSYTLRFTARTAQKQKCQALFGTDMPSALRYRFQILRKASSLFDDRDFPALRYFTKF